MDNEKLWITNVTLGVRDLERVAQEIEEKFGLHVEKAVTNPFFGTKSSVVWISMHEPLQRLEIMTIEDTSKGYAKILSRLLAEGDRLVSCAIGTEDLSQVATRVKLDPRTFSTTWPDGLKLTFRTIHLPEWRLTFIEYEPRDPEQMKAWEVRAAAWEKRYEKSGAKPIRISWAEFGGEEEQLLEFPGGANLPIRFSDGPPGISAAGITTSAGEIVIR